LDQNGTRDNSSAADTSAVMNDDMRGLSDEEVEKWTASYIAVAKVLNEDDSWFHLLGCPTGSRFMRNFETGEYEVCGN
jgi:hypothetical protein